MINKFYLSKVNEIKGAFHKKRDFTHVQLLDFFEPKPFLSLQRELQKLTLRYEKKPMLHRYSSSSLSLSLRKKIFSPDTLDFLCAVVGQRIQLQQLKLYSFSSGDYTLLNDSRTEKWGIDIIFDFTERWDLSWGGSVTYVNGTGDALKLTVKKNSVMIIQRQEEEQRFVKYVNHLAGKERRLFLLITL